MNYKETLSYLFNSLPMYQSIGKAAYKADLNNSLALDKHLGKPHKAFLSIHVAGTNGKGSVSHMLASVFQTCGYKTGLYTSPHLFDFRERIKINGEPISPKEVVQFVAENRAVFEAIQPSFFEMTVAMAFNAFRIHNVDVAIIETGLGGRLDSTNIITPVLSVITNIALDHTQFLGSTFKEIAAEKAGIIKAKVPVVIGETHNDTRAVFTERARALSAPIVFADTSCDTYLETHNLEHQLIKVNAVCYQLDLLGAYQQKNITTVITALNLLKKRFVLPTDKIYEALTRVKKNTGLHGRWEVVAKEPLTICETSHNEAGIIEMVQQLNKYNAKTLHIITGMVKDKDSDSMLKHLPKKARYYFTRAQISRALHQDKLKEEAKKFCLYGDAFSCVDKAIKAATHAAKTTDVIIIAGSIFLIADALSYFKQAKD